MFHNVQLLSLVTLSVTGVCPRPHPYAVSEKDDSSHALPDYEVSHLPEDIEFYVGRGRLVQQHNVMFPALIMGKAAFDE